MRKGVLQGRKMVEPLENMLKRQTVSMVVIEKALGESIIVNTNISILCYKDTEMDCKLKV